MILKGMVFAIAQFDYIKEVIMLTIDLEPELEDSLNTMSKEQRILLDELVKQFIRQNLAKPVLHSASFIEHLLTMPSDNGEFESGDTQFAAF
jgi:hypothetical protein